MKTAPASRSRAIVVFGVVVTALSPLATPVGGLDSVRLLCGTSARSQYSLADDARSPTRCKTRHPSKRPSEVQSSAPSETSPKPSPKPSLYPTQIPTPPLATFLMNAPYSHSPSLYPSQAPTTTPSFVPSNIPSGSIIPSTSSSPVPTCTCKDTTGISTDTSTVSIGFVGHVGDAEIENYELENAVLELAGGMRNSNRRLMSVQVNDVNLSFRFNVVCPDEDQQNCEALQFDFALEGIRDNTTEANNFKDWLVQAIGNSILVQNNTIEVFAPKTDDQTDPPKLTAGEKFAAATGSIVGFFAILLGYFKLFDPLMGLYLFGIVKQMYHVYWKKDTLTTVTNHSDVTMELIICEDTQDFTNARTSSLSFTFLSKILPNDIGVSQVFGTEETYTTGRRLQHFSIPKGQQKVFYVRTDYHTALARYTGKEKYAGKFSDEYPGERRGYMIYELSMRTTEGSEFSIEAGIPKQDEIEFVPIARWEDWKEKFRGDDESVSKRGAENEDEGELDPQFFINSTIRDDVQWYFKFLEGVYRAYVFWRAGYCNAIENKSDKALDLIIRENKTQVTTFDRSSFSYGFPEFIFGEGGTEVEFGHQQTFTTGRKVQWMHLLPGQTKRISIRADYEIATATYKKPEEGSIFEKGYNVHEIKQLPWTQKKYVIGPESASGKVYFVKLGQWREFVRTMTKSSGPENQPWMPDEDRDVRLRRSLAPPVRPPVLKNYDRSVSLPFLREETAVGAGNAAWVPLPLLRPADTPAEGPWNAI